MVAGDTVVVVVGAVVVVVGATVVVAIGTAVVVVGAAAVVVVGTVVVVTGTIDVVDSSTPTVSSAVEHATTRSTRVASIATHLIIQLFSIVGCLFGFDSIDIHGSSIDQQHTIGWQQISQS